MSPLGNEWQIDNIGAALARASPPATSAALR